MEPIPFDLEDVIRGAVVMGALLGAEWLRRRFGIGALAALAIAIAASLVINFGVFYYFHNEEYRIPHEDAAG